MIKASLGTVQLTKANYELCDLLKTTPQEVDFVVEAGLKTDLTCILSALIKRYGLDKALTMWQGAVEVYIEAEKMKGDNNGTDNK